eukprot:scaffold96856_cov63-Phaeocystis_antarctica.AAC.6
MHMRARRTHDTHRRGASRPQAGEHPALRQDRERAHPDRRLRAGPLPEEPGPEDGDSMRHAPLSGARARAL